MSTLFSMFFVVLFLFWRDLDMFWPARCLNDSMKAIVATAAGGPEVLEYTDVAEPSPGPGEVVVQVAAAGVNFIDTYRRSGVYPTPFPHVVGSEGAGVVVAAGAETNAKPGDRVAWAQALGSYAELVAVDTQQLLPVPDELDLRTAAALPLQGMTAHYLCRSTYPVAEGTTALVHAAAGGVGGLLTQLIVAHGGRVIGTAGTAQKAELAASYGAEKVLVYTQLDDLTTELPALVRDQVPGGVDVVYDGVGKMTFDASLASLKTRGMLVLFGGSSGQVPPFDLQRLNSSGSLFVTRPTLAHYTLTRDETRWRAGEVFSAAADRRLQVPIGAEFSLAKAAAAHRALEGRQTTGKVILTI